MALFGRLLRAEALPASQHQALEQVNPTAPPFRARRGLFGRLGNDMSWADRLYGLGAIANDAARGGNSFSEFMTDYRERPIREMQIEQARQEMAATQAERERQQRARQALEDWARNSGNELYALAPEAALQGELSATLPLTAAQNADVKNSVLNREQDQQQFQQSLAEQRRAHNLSAGGSNSAPSGYRFTPNGDLEAIPGGPADLRATAAGQQRISQMDSSISSLQNAIGVLDSAGRHVSGQTAGVVGQVTRNWGGTPAYDLNQELEPVRSILSFENLAEMRRNSQTGGALGSIAVRELELLGSTVRSLDTAQSPTQLRAALFATRQQLARTLQAVQAARQEAAGGGRQPQQQQSAPRVIELDP